MKFAIGNLHFAISRPPRVIIVRQPKLKPHVMNEALGQMTDAHPVWRTLTQLLDERIDAAWQASASHVDETSVSASFLGGAKHLAQFRDDLYTLRLAGQKNMERRKPGE